jgi:hypothetical protein
MPQKKRVIRKGKKPSKPSKPAMTASKVAKIAKASVKQVAEKKFFDVIVPSGLIPRPALAAADNYISALGFSTTNNEDPYVTNTNVQFPSNVDVQSLGMLTPFTTAAPDRLKGYIPDGKVLQPVSAKCHWNIQRDFSYLFKGVNSVDQVFTDDLIRNLWVDIRMIQVTPKIAPGTSGSELEPRLDLLKDNYGNFCGIDSLPTLPFTNNEMFHFKVNNRRYEVIEDKQFTLGNPVTLEWQRYGTGADERYQPRVTNVNKQAELNVTTYHKLSQRKNGKVYYNEVGDIEPTNGHRREYVFWLFKYRAGDAVINAVGTANITSICPVELVIKATPESKFIDV